MDAESPRVAMLAARARAEAYSAAPNMLGVDLTPKSAPEVEAPPVGGVRLGVSTTGLVVIRLREPSDEILLTADQAQSFGRGLLKHAQKARKVKS